jgi:hypothetical protein
MNVDSGRSARTASSPVSPASCNAASEARRAYQQAGRVADDVTACLTMGEAAASRQDAQRAEDWYQRGLARARETEFWLGASVAHRRLGELAESVADMRAAAGQHALAVTVAMTHGMPGVERSLKALIKLRRQTAEEELRRHLTAALGPATADVLIRMTYEGSDPQP